MAWETRRRWEVDRGGVDSGCEEEGGPFERKASLRILLIISRGRVWGVEGLVEEAGEEEEGEGEEGGRAEKLIPDGR